MTVALRAIGPTEKDKYLAFRMRERRRRRETITKVSTENKGGLQLCLFTLFWGLCFDDSESKVFQFLVVT